MAGFECRKHWPQSMVLSWLGYKVFRGSHTNLSLAFTLMSAADPQLPSKTDAVVLHQCAHPPALQCLNSRVGQQSISEPGPSFLSCGSGIILI